MDEPKIYTSTLSQDDQTKFSSVNNTTKLSELHSLKTSRENTVKVYVKFDETYIDSLVIDTKYYLNIDNTVSKIIDK
jgi:non-homologous end joining protein Ku